jgi:hypothetical protein
MNMARSGPLRIAATATAFPTKAVCPPRHFVCGCIHGLQPRNRLVPQQGCEVASSAVASQHRAACLTTQLAGVERRPRQRPRDLRTKVRVVHRGATRLTSKVPPASQRRPPKWRRSRRLGCRGVVTVTDPSAAAIGSMDANRTELRHWVRRLATTARRVQLGPHPRAHARAIRRGIRSAIRCPGGLGAPYASR